MASGTHICKTALIVLVFLSKGLYNELAGPAMMDLKLIFNTNYASLTGAMSGRGMGGVVGALLGGIIADKFKQRLDLCIGLFCVLAAAVLALIPLAPTIEDLWFLYFGMGCATCVLNICGTRLILVMWEEKSTTVLQVIHMGYGSGALLTPLICAPFLATVEVSADNSFRLGKESSIQIPFFGISIFTLLLSVPFIFWPCNRLTEFNNQNDPSKPILPTKTTKQIPWKEMINPALFYTNGKFYFRILMVILLSIYYFNMIGCEKVFGNFIRTFSVEALKFDNNQASYLNTMFWVSFTLGRLFVSIIARFVHVNTIMILIALTHLGSVSFLKYFASGTVSLFWIGTFFEGFLVSPLSGLGVSIGSTHMEVSGMILTVLVLAGSLGDLTYMKASGQMFDTNGPSAILEMMNIAAWFIMVTVIVMWICGRKMQTGNKHMIQT